MGLHHMQIITICIDLHFAQPFMETRLGTETTYKTMQILNKAV